MAYLCIMASVPHDQVGQIRGPTDLGRVASLIATASHMIAPYPDLKEAMDGGTALDTDTWHPLRGFMHHTPAQVRTQADLLSTLARQMTDAEHPLNNEWMKAEVAKVIALFQHASELGEAVVTCLDLNRPGKKRQAKP